jgi:uncharacterized coiled-coil protein SlyX
MSMTHSDTEQSGNAEHAPAQAGENPLANRLGDLEFKLAFLERELGTWKDAVDDLHARLGRSEAELRKALRELRGQDGRDGSGQPFGGEDAAESELDS